MLCVVRPIDFYADQRRATSPETAFGATWHTQGQGPWTVTWLQATGELVAVRRGNDATATAPDDVVDELGDVLFCVVNVARHLGHDPESALRAAVAKFRRRFAAVEALAAARGLDLSAMDLAGLDALWEWPLQGRSEHLVSLGNRYLGVAPGERRARVDHV